MFTSKDNYFLTKRALWIKLNFDIRATLWYYSFYSECILIPVNLVQIRLLSRGLFGQRKEGAFLMDICTSLSLSRGRKVPLSKADHHPNRKVPPFVLRGCARWIVTFPMVFLFFLFNFPIMTKAQTIQLPQTGQTKCFDSLGIEIACSGTRQDGDIQGGMPWPYPRLHCGCRRGGWLYNRQSHGTYVAQRL